MTIDVLYLAWNRLAFTMATFEALLANTEWALVNRLCVYDDSSTDGTADYLLDAIRDAPVEVSFVSHGLRSPVEVMNSYIHDYHADVFAKVDNDIMCPPGWLETMAGVLDRHPALELLGAEPSMCAERSPATKKDHRYSLCSHIGGVGLMRTDAFTRRGGLISSDGRFGFTEWQHQRRPKRGWICPDLLLCSLDRVPVEPYAALSETYIAEGWQRRWPKYDVEQPAYWDWFTHAGVSR